MDKIRKFKNNLENPEPKVKNKTLKPKAVKKHGTPKKKNKYYWLSENEEE